MPLADECDDSADDFEAAIRNCRVKFVSDFRSTSSATAQLCEKAVSGCNNVVEQTVAHLKDFVLRHCAGAVSSEIVDEISEEFDRFGCWYCTRVCWYFIHGSGITVKTWKSYPPPPPLLDKPPI